MFHELLGKTLTGVVVDNKNDTIIFTCDDGAQYKMYHDQDCCEGVGINDVVGEIDDLLNSPILQADEESNDEENNDGIQRWTFYKLATVKGYVTLCWYGSSNGYYSVAVDVVRLA